MTQAPALEARGITKRFPGVLANDHIDFSLARGEIHALLGENGAGKSTLMNILYGLYQPDEGQILIDGQPVVFHDPNDAIARGIGMVHQHFMLIPPLTVTENIILGREPDQPAWRWLGKIGLIDRNGPEGRIRELSKQYGLQVEPRSHVRDLAVGQQQRVEIIKALYRNADILILDEPTAVLTPQEAGELFSVLRGMTKQGKSIVFISHKLKEVLQIAHRITVLRAGRTVGSTTPAQATEATLAEMMVGRKVILQVEKKMAHPGNLILEVSHLTANNDLGQQALNEVSFQVYEGEVLGVAGVQGNGQTELVEALTGLRPIISGTVTIDGKPITHATPGQVIETGVGHIPEDRQKFGLVLSYPVADNLVLSTFDKPPFAQGILVNEPAVETQAKRLVGEFDIRTPTIFTAAGTLSGGNQQKVIVAREFSRPNRLLIASQPTRGLDVGSIEFIHRRLIEQRAAGAAVLLVSAELDEILALSDRVAVMFQGRILDILPAAQATRERLGLLMAGVTEVSHGS